MANVEHFNKLRGDLNDWNEWRKDNPQIKPDLTSAPLQGAVLINADLSRANLSGAHLNGAELHNANFNEANLAFADLTKSKRLNVAQLCQAENLYETKMNPKLRQQVEDRCPEVFCHKPDETT
jgi:uncharacterized protein YjbI with pentapeptide repeats